MPDVDGESESLRSDLKLFPTIHKRNNFKRIKSDMSEHTQPTFPDMHVIIWKSTIRDEDIQMLGERLPPRSDLSIKN